MPKIINYIVYVALAFLPVSAIAETIKYEIYSLPFFFGNREMIARGRLDYTHADVQVVKGPIVNIENWTKTLSISHGFSIGTTVSPEPKIEGFGLWMKKNGKGFSWEWFKLEKGNIFRKLQGAGRVKVRLKKENGMVELASIEFLETVTFRLDTMFMIPFWDGDTHNLVVKKGSVLWLAP